jgi:hypothetical protein
LARAGLVGDIQLRAVLVEVVHLQEQRDGRVDLLKTKPARLPVATGSAARVATPAVTRPMRAEATRHLRASVRAAGALGSRLFIDGGKPADGTRRCRGKLRSVKTPNFEYHPGAGSPCSSRQGAGLCLRFWRSQNLLAPDFLIDRR